MGQQAGQMGSKVVPRAGSKAKTLPQPPVGRAASLGFDGIIGVASTRAAAMLSMEGIPLSCPFRSV